uniref:Uncharacterized protein n=1 Tax=Glossina palpalis gambiensis TaxID=67801 RepID=A0A1B0C1W9_9MUSC
MEKELRYVLVYHVHIELYSSTSIYSGFLSACLLQSIVHCVLFSLDADWDRVVPRADDQIHNIHNL